MKICEQVLRFYGKSAFMFKGQIASIKKEYLHFNLSIKKHKNHYIYNSTFEITVKADLCDNNGSSKESRRNPQYD